MKILQQKSETLQSIAAKRVAGEIEENFPQDFNNKFLHKQLRVLWVKNGAI